jgi:predicted O-methyltransferase YrrM
MKQLVFLLRFLNYYVKGSTKYDIHSPFVFQLMAVFEDNNPYPTYHKIEALRKQLLNNKSKLVVKDLGATSANTNHPINVNTNSISAIAKRSAKPAKYAQLLFRLAKHLQPNTVIELGTSLGISALYQASALPNSKIITCEGSDEIANVARKNFSQSGTKNIECVVGNFDQTFETVLNRFKSVDWIFFDGNHRKEPTLRYFELALKKANKNTVFIFDDINWSNEMQEAWQVIKQHPSVTVTLDIYMMGFVFFNTDLSKENFTIRF